MTEFTHVISTRFGVKGGKSIVFYMCNNGKEYTVPQMCDVKGVSQATFRLRYSRLKNIGEQSNPVLFHVGHLTNDVLEEHGIYGGLDSNIKWFDRSRCKRNSVLCVKYIDCQDSRLGLSDDKWTDPADTDICYSALVIPYRQLYGRPLDLGQGWNI